MFNFVRRNGFAVLLAVCLVSALIFAGSLYAAKAEAKGKTAEKAAPAEAAAPEAAPVTQDFSDAKIDAFLQVDAAAQRINIEANRQIRAALETAGITVEDYNAIVKKLTQEPQFLERVKQRAAAMSQTAEAPAPAKGTESKEKAPAANK
ncbi:MAG: DUF4168 domain-containing protein [Candidatus Omnitrophica bacterium]|nr:DUF4168 domain-containing protein [Candidatus Omnitrophota bacterium]